MPGVVFLIVVPTANFERQLLSGNGFQKWDNNDPMLCPVYQQQSTNTLLGNNNQLLQPSSGNISEIHENTTVGADNNTNALLRLEVELRDKNAPKNRKGYGRGGGGVRVGGDEGGGGVKISHATTAIGSNLSPLQMQPKDINVIIPMEKVLEELLFKLEIDHVTWSSDKKGYYYHVVFPLPAGEPCETTLHCLTELGIGKELNSSVSVLPCSVSYDAISDAQYKEELSEENDEQLSKWNDFVESIKSKLTVKQVVDGVRAGGSLSFDYLLLIVTADSLAALGLVENNAPNIVAAMLVSPLMGPVMSITFGAIISDRELVKVGFISLALGMFISVLFGFIFGLILGTTQMPWGFGDWPTEEMRGRGNARSLWMGVLWALTSGTGVAVALLQGSAGPLIGVAISASLLPPVVNCGLFWALACIWLIYPNIKIPHLKGEPYVGNSTYEFIYTSYLPTEFLINGIVSGLLTVVNVICIFITAIIVLKIKEVSAPYTASPDLKRFWETDLRTARKTNRSTMRKKPRSQLNLAYEGLEDTSRNQELETVVEQALQEATEDVTFQKVKRMSYSSNAARELPYNSGSLGANISSITNSASPANAAAIAASISGLTSVRNSKLNYDLKALDKLVSALLEQQNQQQQQNDDFNNTAAAAHHRKSSMKLTQRRPSFRTNSILKNRGSSLRNAFAGGGSGSGSRSASFKSSTLPSAAVQSSRSEAILESMTSSVGADSNKSYLGDVVNNLNLNAGGGNAKYRNSGDNIMPTILEQNQSMRNSKTETTKESWTEKARNSANMSVRNVLSTIASSMPQRHGGHGGSNGNAATDEENINLTHNIID